MSLPIVLFLGFVCGVMLPLIASRFGKLIPADPGTILMMLFHRPRWPKGRTAARHKLLRKKWKKLLFFMVLWGIAQACLWGVAFVFTPSFLHGWAFAFLWIVSVLIIIDQQYFLLPDFFTIPLLLLGFGVAHAGGVISVAESFWGACFGYALSTVSVMLMSFFKKAEFGGGDFKMMTALGAWLGILGLNYTVVLSFFFFAVPAFFKKNRVGAYGPALGFAGILIFFCLYVK